jgi:protein-S-isoprenylcysteine O-methyltransferase Ste14
MLQAFSGADMRPLPFVWPYALPFWVIYVWAFWPEFAIVRNANRSRTSTDARSLQVIVMGMWVALLAAFPLAWVSAFQFQTRRALVFWIGVAVFVAGALLRRHCWRMLGESFTGDVRVRPDQQIVTRGAYAILRHPSYTGGILLLTGIGISLGSWASALLLLAASVAVYTYRMIVEERALLAALGEPYREFMRTRKRVIPFIY